MSPSFRKFAGACAVLAGGAGFLYAVAFLILSRSAPEAGRFWSPLFLTLGSLLSTAAFAALYQQVKATDESFALWALLLAVVGTIGAAAHAAYDLATAIHPIAQVSGDAPSPIDPRGFLTFGVTGAALLTFARLIGRSDRLPGSLASLGALFGALLILLYLARLIVLTPSAPVIAVPAIVTGFVVGPLWYVWLGLALLRAKS